MKCIFFEITTKNSKIYEVSGVLSSVSHNLKTNRNRKSLSKQIILFHPLSSSPILLFSPLNFILSVSPYVLYIDLIKDLLLAVVTEEQEEKLFKIDKEPEPLWTTENVPHLPILPNVDPTPNGFPKPSSSAIETDFNPPLHQDHHLNEENSKTNNEEEEAYIWVM
jgi:hypothetical protein